MRTNVTTKLAIGAIWLAALPMRALADCENGCGPNGWIGDAVGTVLDPLFLEACQRHDECYCHATATYCKTREECDDDFRADMLRMCRDVHAGEPIAPAACEAAAEIAYAAVAALGESFFVDPSVQHCMDYDGLGIECPEAVLLTVIVDASFRGCPQLGTSTNPVTTVSSGASRVASGGTLVIAAGLYPETLTIATSITLTADAGSVTIGGQ